MDVQLAVRSRRDERGLRVACGHVHDELAGRDVARAAGALSRDRRPLRERTTDAADRVPLAHPASLDARGGRTLAAPSARLRVRRSAFFYGHRVDAARDRTSGPRVRVKDA